MFCGNFFAANEWRLEVEIGNDNDGELADETASSIDHDVFKYRLNALCWFGRVIRH